MRERESSLIFVVLPLCGGDLSRWRCDANPDGYRIGMVFLSVRHFVALSFFVLCFSFLFFCVRLKFKSLNKDVSRILILLEDSSLPPSACPL